MKKLVAILSVLAFLVVVIGCGKAETPQEKFKKQATAKIEEMQKKIDKLKGDYNAKVTEMRKKFEEKMVTGKKKYDEAVGSLKAQEDAAKKELKAMKSATGEAWEKAKEKMTKMLDSMEKAYEHIKAQMKE